MERATKTEAKEEKQNTSCTIQKQEEEGLSESSLSYPSFITLGAEKFLQNLKTFV